MSNDDNKEHYPENHIVELEACLVQGFYLIKWFNEGVT